MSKYGVYIIECLRKDNVFDGRHLGDILKVCKIESVYNRITSRNEFIAQIHKFKLSNLRYLHLSFHGSNKGIEIGGELVSNADLVNILKGALLNSRVFMSACKTANRELASNLISINRAYSLIGTPISLRFDKSIMFWPAFYHVMAEADRNKMTR